MSSNISVEIEGLDEMKKAFDKSPALFVKIFDEAIKKTIFTLVGTSRQWTPVDTGFLRETGMQTTFEALVGRLDNTAPYAVYVHEGTKKMDARPFFDQGIETAQGDIDNFFDSALETFNNSL